MKKITKYSYLNNLIDVEIQPYIDNSLNVNINMMTNKVIKAVKNEKTIIQMALAQFVNKQIVKKLTRYVTEKDIAMDLFSSSNNGGALLKVGLKLYYPLVIRGEREYCYQLHMTMAQLELVLSDRQAKSIRFNQRTETLKMLLIHYQRFITDPYQSLGYTQKLEARSKEMHKKFPPQDPLIDGKNKPV